MARKNTTGVDPNRVREVMKLHRVSRWTAHRWLKANDVPPVGAVQTRIAANGRFWYHRLDKQVTRRDLQISLRIARSCVKRAERLAYSDGFYASDFDMLREIATRANDMCATWQRWQSAVEEAGTRET